ncbi:zinc carboxypeptidase-like [Vanessa cardui]|uniref:zinc carboxypeptidase-like n=1 Tax=Vanessa cardui TaxID=171605 RepID=UPI001F1332DE|nr:zinc carboxypeptidase-like [Vanessa cardui]
MKILYLELVIFAVLIVAVSGAYKSYENYKVYKIVPTTDEQVQILNDLGKEEYDLWTDVIVVNKDVRIMVPPNKDNQFVKYIKSVGMDPVVKISNVQELIHAQMKSAKTDRSSSLGSFNWNEYHDLQRIHAWLDELQTMYPDNVKTVTIGRSNEGREIKGVIIDLKPGDRGNNPLTGMIEGGIHSREWISPATVTWIIKEFLTSNDPDTRFMAETFVWHIFPVVNPDGYVYTFLNDRMWRKNRNLNYSTNCPGNNDLSNGIDLNRNFDYLWMTVGASSDPCTQTYAGPSPASEPETQAISNYLLSLKRTGNVLYYFAFHSYSQMTLIPFSHLSGMDVLQVSNYADLYEIAIRGAEKLTQTHGTNYQVGTSADILYSVSGSSFDWVKGVGDIPIVYLFELRDVGEYGFLLPPEQIIPNNEEIMACLVEMDRTTRELRYYSGGATIYASLISIMISAAFVIIVK